MYMYIYIYIMILSHIYNYIYKHISWFSHIYIYISYTVYAYIYIANYIDIASVEQAQIIQSRLWSPSLLSLHTQSRRSPICSWTQPEINWNCDTTTRICDHHQAGNGANSKGLILLFTHYIIDHNISVSYLVY